MTIWLAYIAAALTASALFISAGWRSRIVAGSGATRYARTPGSSHSLADSSAQSGTNAQIGDAAEAIDLALKRLHAVIQDRHARIEFAAQPGLLVRMRPGVLADMAAELLALSIHAVPGGRFLLTASQHGGHVEITLSDDGVSEDAGPRQSQARALAQRVALQGGSLEVVTLAGQGTSTTLRLAGAFTQPATPASETPAEAQPMRANQLL